MLKSICTYLHSRKTLIARIKKVAYQRESILQCHRSLKAMKSEETRDERVCAGGAQPRLEDPALPRQVFVPPSSECIHLRMLPIISRDCVGKVGMVDPHSDENTNASHDNAFGPAESWRLG